jgi:hypothetical protein
MGISMFDTTAAHPGQAFQPSASERQTGRGMTVHASRLAACSLLLLGASAMPTLAGAIFASAYGGDNVNFFFELQPKDAGGDVSGFGHVLLNLGGTEEDGLPLTAMAGVKGQLKATSVSAGGTFDYYSNITPRSPGGAYTSENGDVTELNGGVHLTEPVSTMAPHQGELVGTSWTGSFNYIYDLHDQPDGTGAYGNDFGGVTVGEGGQRFGYEIETMADYGGQLYGTAFDGTETLFFRINRDADGAGAWIDALGALDIGADGLPDHDHVDAMVGADDGLYATSWNSNGNFNYLFRILPEASGIGGYETDVGAVTLDGVKLPYRIDTLAYLPSVVDVDAPGGVPEPATWAMMILGFGLTGAACRTKRARSYLAA